VLLELHAAAVLRRAGALSAGSPGEFARVVGAIRAYGPFAGAPAVAAHKFGDRPAVVDDDGTLSYAELERQVTRLARAWLDQGLAGATVGILCRNSRTPLVAAFAGGRIGARVVWLNSEFAAPQCREVCAREGIELVVHDVDLADRLTGITFRHGTVSVGTGAPYQLAAFAGGSDEPVPRPRERGKLVLLTSGTTGTPKGAQRGDARSMVVAAALVERVGLAAGERMVVAPPLFHGTGLGFAMVTLALGGTLVLRRRFDPERCLSDIREQRATSLIAVPVMLRRILNVEAPAGESGDLRTLRAIVSAGSRMTTDLPIAVMDRFGDILFNLYGSTETAGGTIATPAELRSTPDTAGRPWLGTELRILDDRGRDVEPGQTGGIYIRSAALPIFEGYTGGGSKEIIDGYVSSGDRGHLDHRGCLFVDGRDDEMVVCGGENVFPGEVESAIASYEYVEEAAVVGVDDPEFGQRLCAFVVPRAGHDLTAEDIRNHVRGALARFKVPRDVVFVDELPRNATGKVLKRNLPVPTGLIAEHGADGLGRG
jgi:fatty-acyl-CoA synthase